MLQRWLTSLALAFSYSVIGSCVEKILLATALLDSCFDRFSCMFCARARGTHAFSTMGVLPENRGSQKIARELVS